MIFNLFILLSNVATTKYVLSDFFEIRDVLNPKTNKETTTIDDKHQMMGVHNSIEVLTMNSINWELSSIIAENLFTISTPKTIPPPLTNNDYIINRLDLTKSCSLLESDFDFDKHQVIPSNHFLVCSPKKIILDNQLPFFHAVLEIYLKDLATTKIDLEMEENTELSINKKEPKQKSTYVTVNELKNIELEIPNENFHMIVSEFIQYYKMYAASYKNFIVSKESLKNHKLELSKFLRKEFDWNK
jgi:hypothetical protein